MKTILAILSLALLVLVTGCATTSTTGTTTAKTNAEIVTDAVNIGAPTLKLAVKIATKAVLKNNPYLVDQIGTISTVAAAIINSGSMDSAAITTALEANMPKLDKATAQDIGDAIETLWTTAGAYYQSKTGNTLTLSGFSNDNVTTVLTAIADGVTDGVTAYKAIK
jgi:hypothetical protein